MLSSRQNASVIKIISLGEIITIDIDRAKNEFVSLIAKKKNESECDVKPLIDQVLIQNYPLINQFKLGQIAEEGFTQKMIQSFLVITQVQLTAEEFHQAWNKMNPGYEQFSAPLQEIIRHNKESGEKVIFISFTNVTDMGHLKYELKNNNVNYVSEGERWPDKILTEKDVAYVDDVVSNIDGIPVYTTYQMKKTKAELIELIIKNLHHPEFKNSPLAKSMSSLYNSDAEKSPQILYIRGVNAINDPILKHDLDLTNQAVEKKAEKFSVDTIIWMKRETSLTDILKSDQTSSKRILATNL